MSVQTRLLETLEDLGQEDFKRFQWWLVTEVLDGCTPIARARLENKDRLDTVTVMTNTYNKEMAVKVAADILKKMNNNLNAEKLNKSWAAGGNTTAPSTSTSAAAAPVAPLGAPGTMTAQQSSVIIAPTLAGGTSGTWNISINK